MYLYIAFINLTNVSIRIWDHWLISYQRSHTHHENNRYIIIDYFKFQTHDLYIKTTHCSVFMIWCTNKHSIHGILFYSLKSVCAYFSFPSPILNCCVNYMGVFFRSATYLYSMVNRNTLCTRKQILSTIDKLQNCSFIFI